METQLHLPILKRTGGVLLAVGLLDIAAMIYCIVNRISYSSSFNVFAAVAGIFLLRGSLRAASIVRWFAAFMLSAFIALLLAWPFMQPLGLTLTQLRLNAGASAATVSLLAAILALLFWLFRELGRHPVHAARAAAGRKQRDMRIPILIGVAVVAGMGVFMALLLGGESAAHAKAIAAQHVGSGYSFHVGSLNIRTNGRGKFVSGVVTAWSAHEIKNVPVQWEER